MISRPAAVGLLAAGCLTAAATGAYLAVRENAAAAASVKPAVSVPATAPAQPVSETEAIIEATPKVTEPTQPPAETPVAEPPARKPARPARRSAQAVARASAPPRITDTPAPAVDAPVTTEPRESQPAAEPFTESARVEPAVVEVAPAAPRFEEIVIPASSVIGLEVETSITSERAAVEDRVDARVTRDVHSDGRLVIPAGTRAIGSVTLVERGGKVKERARLGVRFHTLVLADGRQVDIRTDTIFREGESPSGESSRKIGGAAVGGAVIGAILGGGKGAIIGGTAGAAGGTAAVMAGGRNAATLSSGTVVTARLSSPVSVEVERR